MRRVFVSCLIAAGLTSTSAFADEPGACRQFFDTMRGRAVAIFRDDKDSFAERRMALSHLFNNVIDGQWIARYVAGSQWRGASDKDRSDFVAAYDAYLADRYVGGLGDDDIAGMQDIQLVDFTTLDSAAYRARTKVIQRTEDPIDIDFRLEEEPKGTCHVRDFSIEGVSLLSNQRDQVQSLAQSGGLKNVTQKLLEIIHNQPAS